MWGWLGGAYGLFSQDGPCWRGQVGMYWVSGLDADV